MARLREFNTDEVMEAFINAFWERGYEATSLADLMAVTGLQKGSIYKAFGDKRSLFLKALQSYLDRNYCLMQQVLDSSSPEAAISAWLRLLSGVTDAPESCKGCFAVNSLLEMAPHDLDVAKMLEYQHSRTGKLLETVIAQGQKGGVFRRDLSTQHLRQMLLVIASGMSVSGRAAFLKPGLPNVAEAVLAVLRA
jgi:TetR/AcrR family transcriptional regulator, transcriptional repressor for nem operon